MAVMTSAPHLASSNRRRRVRHKIQMPAYATFTADSPGAMLDLHEIVDISENGAAIECHSPLAVDKHLNLCLDLADSAQPFYTTARVIWSNASGRTGLHFSELSAASVARLREWLFVNVFAQVVDGEASPETYAEAVAQAEPEPAARAKVSPRPDYTDILAAVSAVQRQAEALGSDLAAVLQLIATCAQTLVRASGAAIALADSDPDFMICRASSGPDAPPVGARLQVGSGFSGQCVQTGMLLRCDDTELDVRVDRQNCRALGLRSILAAPVRAGGKSIGILEAFSSEPDAFSETDGAVLQRLVQTVLAAVNRAARAEDLPPLATAPAAPKFAPSPGSVLFASAPEEEKKTETAEEKSFGGISLPLSHLVLLICTAIIISLVLGIASAPWIQAKLRERRLSSVQTVLASSPAPASDPPAALPVPTVETATFEQLRQMAENDNPAAENAIGLRYATGEGVKADEHEAVRWFTRAAEHGNVSAQSKLGAIYFSGRGVPQDFNQAYFWMYLARAGGDRASKMLAPSVMARLTRAQATSIEQQADGWLHLHLATWKPSAGH
jgi:GAF domain-containing protein